MWRSIPRPLHVCIAMTALLIAVAWVGTLGRPPHRVGGRCKEAAITLAQYAAQLSERQDPAGMAAASAYLQGARMVANDDELSRVLGQDVEALAARLQGGPQDSPN